MVNGEGRRLAKRDGAVSMADLHPGDAPSVLAQLTASLGLGPCRTTREALAAMPGDQRFYAGAVWSEETLLPISPAR